MTKEQKAQALALRAAGNTYFQIATMLSVPKNTVKSFCQRHPQEIIHIKEEPILDDTHGTTSFCRKCGKPLIQKPGRKPMVFCSSECRVTWWNQHPEKVNQKAIYHFTCACCGKPFDAYGNAKREYCSHACYIMEMLNVNIAVMPAISRTGSMEAALMTRNELETEICYTRASMIAKSLYEKGLLTREEYCQIDTILLSNILPKIGALCPISCKE